MLARTAPTIRYDYLSRSEAQVFDDSTASDAVDMVVVSETPPGERATHECFIPNPTNPECTSPSSPGVLACGAWSGVMSDTLCNRIGGKWVNSRQANGMWDEYNTPQTTGGGYVVPVCACVVVLAAHHGSVMLLTMSASCFLKAHTRNLVLY